MTKLQIIDCLCKNCVEPTIGIFDYDGTHDSLAFAFGDCFALPEEPGSSEPDFPIGLYIYDYDCSLGPTPDVILMLDGPESDTIGLYYVED